MDKILKYVLQYILLFAIGGCGYYYVEVFTRGWSHFSMFYLGGICFCFFSIQKKVTWWKQGILNQVVRCLVFLLCGEFITGCMVNLWKGWQVWDYSQVPLNLYGQICFPMALVFAILCYLALVFEDWIQVYAFGQEHNGFSKYALISNSNSSGEGDFTKN